VTGGLEVAFVVAELQAAGSFHLNSACGWPKIDGCAAADVTSLMICGIVTRPEGMAEGLGHDCRIEVLRFDDWAALVGVGHVWTGRSRVCSFYSICHTARRQGSIQADE
jgi:hypothetical protein